MLPPMPQEQRGAFSLTERQTERKAEIVFDCRGEIYGTRQPLGMQEGACHDSLHIIVLS